MKGFDDCPCCQTLSRERERLLEWIGRIQTLNKNTADYNMEIDIACNDAANGQPVTWRTVKLVRRANKGAA